MEGRPPASLVFAQMVWYSCSRSAESVTSCLKKNAKSYARGFRIPSGKVREILCQGNAKAFVSAASILGIPVRSAPTANLYRASGDLVTPCLPSRLSRVRAPSPAPSIHRLSAGRRQAVEDNQAVLGKARRRCFYVHKRVQRRILPRARDILPHVGRALPSREIVPTGRIFPHFLPSHRRSQPPLSVAFARIPGNGEGPALRDRTGTISREAVMFCYSSVWLCGWRDDLHV